MKTHTISTALVTLAVAALAAACGGSSDDAARGATSTTTTATVERPTAPIDEVVAAGDGRMHVRCVGRGPTTVLLIAGWGEGGESWGAIEPALAERARVCSYSRFGTGDSDPPAATQTFATQAADLHALLTAAGEPGPYVVVGHSFGGAEGVMFAERHADEVVGLLLLDASPVTWPEAACAVPDDGSEAARSFEQGCALMRDPMLHPERLDVFAAFEEVGAIATLHDLPMTVMSAVHRTLPGLAAGEAARLTEVWDAGVTRWAALSSASTVVPVEHTGHHIQLDQPDLVVDQVLKLLASGGHS